MLLPRSARVWRARWSCSTGFRPRHGVIDRFVSVVHALQATQGMACSPTRPARRGPLRSLKCRENETACPARQSLTECYCSYTIQLLRCFRALPLYASSIRDKCRDRNHARPVRRLTSGRDGLGLSSKSWGALQRAPLGGHYRKGRKGRKPLAPVRAVHAPSCGG
jgi:hypothetical protein